MELFWRHGYEGTSIADLTQALGITPPTLYAAFGSKEQLYQTVLSYYSLHEGVDRERAMEEESSSYRAFECYLRQAAHDFSSPGRPSGCMISTASLQCAVENVTAAQSTAKMRAATLEVMEAKLDEARARGELPEQTDTQALARFFGAILQGMSVQAIDGASTAELEAIVDMAMAAWPGKRPAARACPAELRENLAAT